MNNLFLLFLMIFFVLSVSVAYVMGMKKKREDNFLLYFESGKVLEREIQLSFIKKLKERIIDQKGQEEFTDGVKFFLDTYLDFLKAINSQETRDITEVVSNASEEINEVSEKYYDLFKSIE